MLRARKMKIRITKGIQVTETVMLLAIQINQTTIICLNSKMIKTIMTLKISQWNQQMATVMMEAKVENPSKMRRVLSHSTMRRARKNKQLEVLEWFQHKQTMIKITTGQTNQSL